MSLLLLGKLSNNLSVQAHGLFWTLNDGEKKKTLLHQLAVSVNAATHESSTLIYEIN